MLPFSIQHAILKKIWFFFQLPFPFWYAISEIRFDFNDWIEELEKNNIIFEKILIRCPTVQQITYKIAERLLCRELRRLSKYSSGCCLLSCQSVQWPGLKQKNNNFQWRIFEKIIRLSSFEPQVQKKSYSTWIQD